MIDNEQENTMSDYYCEAATAEGRMKIYVASSWRNVYHASLVSALRGLGHDVYDFRAPMTAFRWQDVLSTYTPGCKVSPAEYREMLAHPLAQSGYASDIGALRSCDAVIYVLPCGRSASWEFGYAMGQGKRGYVVMFGDDEPDLMFAEATLITSMNELYDAFGGQTGRAARSADTSTNGDDQ